MDFHVQVEAPKKRSQLRKKIGKQFYIAKRFFEWYLSQRKFARKVEKSSLPFAVTEHSSVLLRKLKDVDMYLQHNKVENLRLAIEKLDGVLIRPGETFSLWYLVGRPTKGKGYKEGLVLNEGKIDKGIGGGLCQLGNLLFWMAIHSPLQVTERYRHSFDVFPDVNRTVPFGCGATLSYNYIDLQLTNSTEQVFQLKLWLTKEKLHGQLLSNRESEFLYEVYEGKHLIRGEVWGGYTRHNQIFRKVMEKQTGQLVRDEFLLQNHAIMMYNPLLEGAK